MIPIVDTATLDGVKTKSANQPVDTAVDTVSASAKRTDQKLSPTGFPGLLRHDNGNFYGRKKVKGAVKLVALKGVGGAPIIERKVAERAFMAWAESLERQTSVEGGGRRATLTELMGMYHELQAKKSLATEKKNIWFKKAVGEAAPKLVQTIVDKITPLDVSRILSHHYTTLAASSYNMLSEYLGRLFAFAVSNGYCTVSPYEKAENKRRKNKRKLPNVPTLEQFTAIVDYVRNQPFSDTREDASDFMEFLGLAALGEAEAAELTWKDVNFKSEEIRVQRQKTETYFVVKFYPWLKPFLLALHIKQGSPTTGKIFAIKGCKKSLANACKNLEYPHFSPRNLRQFGIIRQLRAGLHVKLVAKYQGHRDGGKLILDTYSEAVSADEADFEKAAIAKMGN